jgi:CheY-like chemotaxis protein
MQRRSVLIIEDDHGIRDALRMCLEFEGYKVFAAENGKEGLELLRKISPPGLILLDLLMPVMDGWEFMERVKQEISLSSIPIAIVTAYADRAHGIQGKEIVRKPVDFDALRVLVARHCGESKKSKDRVA